MARMLYEVTVTIVEPAVEQAWLRWIQPGHIQDVVKAGAVSGRLVRLDEPGHGYVVQYEFADRAALDRYLRDHALRLRAEGIRSFPPEQVALSRRIGEIVEDD